MTDATDPPHAERAEAESERLDRNWNELLQELRVVQTGTQILTGFLLTVAFTPRFGDLDGYQLTLYLSLVGLAALATIFALTPVSMHRVLFRQGARAALVVVAHRLMKITIGTMLLTLSGTVTLIFDLVAGHPVGLAVGMSVLAIGATAWFLIPALVRARW